MVAAWYVHRGTRQRWARQQALPEIERLVESSPGSGDLNRWQAFELGSEAERWIPNDPLLERLRERYSGLVTVHTDPPGARVLARPYAAVDEVWESLGVTPIDQVASLWGATAEDREGWVEPIEDLTELPGSGRRPDILRPEAMCRGVGGHRQPHPAAVVVRAGIHMPASSTCRPRSGRLYVDRYEVT
jgi:hypothetical protein